MSNIPAPSSCQLYLLIEPLPPGEAETLVKSALSGGPVAAALIASNAVSSFGEALTQRIIALLQSAGSAALLEDDVALAQRLNADGIHIREAGAEGEAIKTAREKLASGSIIGAEAGLSRHRAMVNGESGADYVSFGAAAGNHEIGQIADIVRWWSELFELPCVARNAGGLEEAQLLAQAGADFLGLGEWVWRHEGGPGRAVKALNELFSAGLR